MKVQKKKSFVTATASIISFSSLRKLFKHYFPKISRLHKLINVKYDLATLFWRCLISGITVAVRFEMSHTMLRLAQKVKPIVSSQGSASEFLVVWKTWKDREYGDLKKLRNFVSNVKQHGASFAQ